MKINEIEVRNFYSFKNFKLIFDDYKGIILIDKKNKDEGGSNGAGGSSIFESVVYGLFGRTIRKSTEDSLVNNRAKKDLKVKIRVNGNCIIERTKRPSSLRFWVGDEELTKESAPETQKIIESTLNTNYKVFVASFVFGQHSNFDFLDANPDDKRLIIKSFLNLDYLFEYREKVKDFKSKYSQEIKIQTAIIEEYIKNVQEVEEQLTLLKVYDNKYISPDWDEYKLEDIIGQENKYKKALAEAVDKKRDLLRIEEKLNYYKGSVSLPCKECGTELTNKEIYSNIIPNLLIKETKLLEISNKLKEIASKLKPSVSLAKLKEFIRYKEVKSKEEYIKKTVDEMSKKSHIAQKITMEAERNYDVMRFWEKAFSESGLVKYVVRNILEYFNTKCNYYLSFLTGDKFLVKFDDSLNEKIYIKGKMVYHNSLSGGESRKINLAIMLGLQSLLNITTKDQSNVLFLDEIAVNLDEPSIDGLYILLQELNKDKTLFIITHNKYLRTLLDNYPTLKIEKKNGISKLI